MGYESKHKGKFVQRLDYLHREAPGVNLPSDFMTAEQRQEYAASNTILRVVIANERTKAYATLEHMA